MVLLISTSLTSRIGFKGSEDLGNGMKAMWLYETQVDFTDGLGPVPNSSAFVRGRQAYAGVSGGFGTVMAGYLYAPTKGLFGFSKTEILGDSVVDNSAYLNAEPAGQAIAYANDFGGIKVAVAAIEGTEAVGDATDLSVTGTVGPVNVGVGSFSPETGDSTTTLAANGKFGDLTVGAIFQDTDGNSAMIVSGAFSFGANTIKVSVADKEAGDLKSTNVALTHALSKRTSAYIALDDENEDMGIGLMHKF
jgi:predicted porin